ncbi:MAG: serine/threonine protein kinase [Gammaproteobacteria bacterium]|nr:serine/threonine protein kinase [Gammaproteobacteria bacterium]
MTSFETSRKQHSEKGRDETVITPADLTAELNAVSTPPRVEESSSPPPDSTLLVSDKEAPEDPLDSTASLHPPEIESTRKTAIEGDRTAAAGEPTRNPDPEPYDAFKSESEGETVGVGSVLKDRFVLEKILGKGGMGVVYKARDLRKVEARDKEPYMAVKVLTKDFQATPDSFIALQREAKKAQLLAHPNIVTVYDFDRDGPNVYMTMELLEGEPLDTLIRRLQPKALPPELAKSIIVQMARALAYAHKNKIVHSDLKPGNIFLTSNNVVKVVDFGIARAVQKPELTASDETVFDPGSLGALTPTYASCEMFERAIPDPRDDVYGMAVVAYELLTGIHPFERKPAIVARNSDLTPKRPKEMSKDLWNAISGGLAFDREKRTLDATMFLQQMSGPRADRASTRKHRLVTLTYALLFSTAVAASLYYYFDLGEPAQIPPIELEDTSVLEPATRERVEGLLEVAEVHQLVGRYLDPPGGNAYEAYQSILRLHENNREAYTGLGKIGDHFEAVARRHLDAGKTEEARAVHGRGIEAVPTHPGLLKLKEELEER